MSGIGPGQRGALYLAVVYALWIFRVFWLSGFERSIQSSVARVAFITCVNGLLWATPAFLFVHRVRGANPFQYLGLSVKPKAKIWALSLLSISLYCFLYFSFKIHVGHKHLSLTPLYELSTSYKIAIIFAAPIIEEVVFRGLILKEMSIVLRPAISNIATSILFVGIHLPYWILSGGQLRDLLSLSIGVFLFSLFSGWLYSHSNSIWPSTVAHAANNAIFFMISAT